MRKGTPQHHGRTSGRKGRRAGVIVQVERNAIVGRVRVGIRRAKVEGHGIGHAPQDIDREQIVRDQLPGISLAQVAKNTESHGRVDAASSTSLRRTEFRLPTLEPRIDQTSAQFFEVFGIPRDQREPMSLGRSSKERIHNT
jgi:hypothetical protein